MSYYIPYFFKNLPSLAYIIHSVRKECSMIRPIIPLAFVVVVAAPVNNAFGENQERLALARATHQIQAILDSISADSIRAYLNTLVGFQFRHTLDDTVSETTGMGAARRWVYKKFQEFSAASGGRLQPQYFDFTRTICNVTTLHRNVLAILPGTLTPERYFVVSGHMDTRGNPTDACRFGIISPGANDDGSGTIVSLELARVMSKYQFDASIIFMAVTGEDEGLFGSEAYAAHAQNTGMRIDGMITNDVVGNIVGEPGGIVDSTSVRHFSSVADATPHRQMSRYMKLKSELYYPTMTVNLIPAVDRPGRGGDHQSFQNHGYTAVRFVEPNENLTNQHSPTDLVENMSPPYTARVARVNATGLATLLWAPQSPSAPTLKNPGNGTSIFVEWPLTNTEPDFAGYRVAVRDFGALTYAMIVDVGKVNQYTLTGLTPGVAVYVSVSAYDTSGHESMFSTESPVRPAVIPSAPGQLGSVSSSGGVLLTWALSPELDVTKYRVYRSNARTIGFVLYDSVTAPVSQFVESNLSPHVLYFYQVRAVDADGNESAGSNVVPGQLATHDLGILVVDGTRDGTGISVSPTDAQVDQYYQTLLSDFRVAGEWDISDSVSSALRISDAEMGAYSTILWHTDVRFGAPVYADTSELRQFLQQGGRLFLGGWRLSGSLKATATVGVSSYPPGGFVPLFLKVDSMSTTDLGSQDFIAAYSVAAGYANLSVDSMKIPNFAGTIVNTDVVLAPFAHPSTTTLFNHHSKIAGSTFEGKPVGWRYLGSDFKVVVFDFPLYYMQQTAARAALRQALIDLGETPLDVEETEATMPRSFQLHQNYPNPFNPSTVIRFDVPVRSNILLMIYNLLGQEVRQLVSEEKQPGVYRVEWDGKTAVGRPASSGVYFYRLVGKAVDGGDGTFVAVRKMLMVQ